jgi:hypothetical protein
MQRDRAEFRQLRYGGLEVRRLGANDLHHFSLSILETSPRCNSTSEVPMFLVKSTRSNVSKRHSSRAFKASSAPEYRAGHRAEHENAGWMTPQHTIMPPAPSSEKHMQCADFSIVVERNDAQR